MSLETIDAHELTLLQKKAQLFDKLNLNGSLNIAQNITNNAIKVNNASKTRLTEIETIEQLINEFINFSNQIQSMSSHSITSASLASNESQKTIQLVEELFDLINNMSTTMNEFSQTIEELNNRNSSIIELVGLNNQISIQTNLLAINAAIEASKAKEYGKGFAIVATEVKKLAQASKQSTQNISSEIDSITNMTSRVAQKSESVQTLVKNSVQISKEAIEKLKSLIVISDENSENSKTISSHVNQQLEGSDSIKNKISHLVEDTRKAIEGSQTNIGLGKTLIENLSASVK